MSSPGRFDVFISYRRESGSAEARLIRERLLSSKWSVFLDVTDLRKGYFDEALLRYIEESPNFLVVLSPQSLDRCVHEQDWLRREIAHAIHTGRNIIPVMMPGFKFPDVLPADMLSLPRHQGLDYSHIYFDAMIAHILENLHLERTEREQRESEKADLAKRAAEQAEKTRKEAEDAERAQQEQQLAAERRVREAEERERRDKDEKERRKKEEQAEQERLAAEEATRKARQEERERAEAEKQRLKQLERERKENEKKLEPPRSKWKWAAVAAVILVGAAVGGYAWKRHADQAEMKEHLANGRRLIFEKKYADAEDEYMRALRIDVNLSEAYNGIGVSWARRGTWAAAERNFREALRITPADQEIRIQLGLALYMQGNLDEALVECRSALRSGPHSTAYRCQAMVLEKKNENKEALAAYQEAFRLDSRDTYSQAKAKALEESLNARSKAADDLSNFAGMGSQAAKMVRESTQTPLKRSLSEKEELPYFRRADKLLDAGKINEAIAAFQDWIDHDTDDTDAHYYMAGALVKKGDLDGALLEYQKALRGKDNGVSYRYVYREIASTLEKKGDLDGAIQAMRKGVALWPRDSWYEYNMLGRLLEKKGDLEGALEQYKKAAAAPAYASDYNRLLARMKK